MLYLTIRGGHSLECTARDKEYKENRALNVVKDLLKRLIWNTIWNYDMVLQTIRRQITVEEYHRMSEAGIFHNLQHGLINDRFHKLNYCGFFNNIN